MRIVRLKLEQLQLDLQVIGFADIAGAIALLADVHGVLKAFQVLLREVDHRLGELHVGEVGGHLEGESALVIGHGRASHGRLVLRRLQAVLPLLAALEEITDADVELRRLVDVVLAELIGLEDRQELRVAEDHGIGPEVGGDLLGLALLDRRTLRQKRVIVGERQLDGVIERDLHRDLGRGGRRRGRWGGRWSILRSSRARPSKRRGDQQHGQSEEKTLLRHVHPPFEWKRCEDRLAAAWRRKQHREFTRREALG